MNQTRVSLAADEFVWSLMPKPSVLTLQSVAYAFEQDVPFPIEHIHIAYCSAPNDDSKILACGLSHERLQQLYDDGTLNEHSWSLTPSTVPTFAKELGEEAALTSALNLLHERWLPKAVKQGQRTVLISAAICLGILLCLFFIGVHLHQRHIQHHINELKSQKTAVLQNIFPAHKDKPAQLFALFTAALRQQAAQENSAQHQDQTNPSIILQALLRSWPHNIKAEVESLSCSAKRLMLRGKVASLADAQSLFNSIKIIEVDNNTYKAAPLQATQSTQAVNFSITYHPLSGAR